MMTTMKAVGFTKPLPIDEEESLLEFETEMPAPGSQDLLVKVSAVSINPVDAKLRIRSAGTELHRPRILGFDASGFVEAVGAEVKGFQPGDRVYYAGDISRSGTNAEYHSVDARIAALAPESLTHAEAAALPLTALTGWEALFDRLRVNPNEEKTLLIIGGAGGVGSISIQIAKAMTGLTVIATASRPETEAWVREMGADHVANHYDLITSVRALGLENVDYIFNTADTKGHWDAMVELIAPQGTICAIVKPAGGVELGKLQEKSAGFVWELMFTRPKFKTDDMGRQGEILAQLARFSDEGRVRTTLTHTIEGLSADSLKEAHRRIESGKTIGKTVVQF